jgi:hypothetical protein
VIAVFTKRDQFRREVKMKLEDQHGSEVDQALIDREMKEIFDKYYLAKLGEAPRFVCLESEYFVNQLACITLNSFFLQKWTSQANSVLHFLKRPPLHFLAISLHSCCCRYRKIIWS